MPYEPNEDDMAWARMMINIIHDGGTLAFPATRLIYILYHRVKVMVLDNPEILESDLPVV